jgi:predicted small lipoprotein YifL
MGVTLSGFWGRPGCATIAAMKTTATALFLVSSLLAVACGGPMEQADEDTQPQSQAQQQEQPAQAATAIAAPTRPVVKADGRLAWHMALMGIDFCCQQVDPKASGADCAPAEVAPDHCP